MPSVHLTDQDQDQDQQKVDGKKWSGTGKLLLSSFQMPNLLIADVTHF